MAQTSESATELPSDGELLDLIANARWHYSKGYGRKDGSQVGEHSYILEKEEPVLYAIMLRRIEEGEHWFGRYQGRGFVYTYATLGDGLTYWRMGLPILNRDRIDRNEREVVGATRGGWWRDVQRSMAKQGDLLE